MRNCVVTDAVRHEQAKRITECILSPVFSHECAGARLQLGTRCSSRLGVFLQRIESKLDLVIKSKGRDDETKQLGGVQALQQHASDLAGKLLLSGHDEHVEAFSEHLLLLFRGSLRQLGSEIVCRGVSLGLSVCVTVHHGESDVAADGGSSSQLLVGHAIPDDLRLQVLEDTASWSLFGGNVVSDVKNKCFGWSQLLAIGALHRLLSLFKAFVRNITKGLRLTVPPARCEQACL
jgi:hypothetical protein